MDVQNYEVTLRVEPVGYRDFNGIQRTRYKFHRMAYVKYSDGTDGFVPVDISVADGPKSTTENNGVIAFFLDTNDVRDNGDGGVVHEVVAEGEA